MPLCAGGATSGGFTENDSSCNQGEASALSEFWVCIDLVSYTFLWTQKINGDSCKVLGRLCVASVTSSMWSYTHSSQQSSSQSPLKKLFGLRRSAQSKHNITPVGLDLLPICFLEELTLLLRAWLIAFADGSGYFSTFHAVVIVCMPAVRQPIAC